MVPGEPQQEDEPGDDGPQVALAHAQSKLAEYEHSAILTQPAETLAHHPGGTPSGTVAGPGSASDAASSVASLAA